MEYDIGDQFDRFGRIAFERRGMDYRLFLGRIGIQFPAEVFETSSKRWTRGLGVLSGSCSRLESTRLKVPHVGWDQVHLTDSGRACELLRDFPEGANMYFTHSYAVDADACAADVAAHTHYTRSFPCVVARGNVFGCQFHPEKSSSRGLDILKNFVAIAAAEQKGGRA